jgi:starch phosphorylase
MAALERLSINLRWSWDKPTQDLFATIDPELWKQVGCDPVALLGQVEPQRLDELAADESFLSRLDALAGDLDDYLSRPL